jgi:hypothetical protein
MQQAIRVHVRVRPHTRTDGRFEDDDIQVDGNRIRVRNPRRDGYGTFE